MIIGCSAACATDPDLGPLAGYYRYDCAGARGPQRDRVREVFRRALAGEHAALRLVFTDRGTFGSGDNEAYSELPQLFLRTLGDERYASFVANQPAAVQESALSLFPEQLPTFEREYPKTARLYHASRSRERRDA